MVTKQDRLQWDKKAKEIVNQMTLEEKVFLMSGNVSREEMMEDLKQDRRERHYNWVPYEAGGNERLNLPSMKFVDGPRGVVSGESTCFPVTMARGATFNTQLEERVGNAIAKEIRAHGGNYFGGVCINLPYNPGWGRSQETYGEDSFHLGAMGSALVKGIQSHNVMACVKHFAFNSMENSRFKINVTCDVRTEKEVYLPHFKEVIDAGAASVMTAYNKYKGEHCGHNSYLMKDVLRDDWGFDGFVISDFVWGIYETVAAANGGMNIEMCNTEFFGDLLVQAVKDGHVSEAQIDEAAIYIARTILAFENAVDPQTYTKDLIGNQEHTDLSREVAEQSITLIKNKNKLLPLQQGKVEKILVLGEMGDQAVIGDHGSSQVFPKHTVSITEGLANYSSQIEVNHYNGENTEYAISLAKEADAVIFVVGNDHGDEGEYLEEGESFHIGGDRKRGLGLHSAQIRLIEEVAPANANSIAILLGGNMIMIDQWEQHVSAILMAYYPGMEGGNAVANILFGEVNPSGKLPYVTPHLESDLPQVNWDTDEQFYGYYHGYAKLDKEQKEAKFPYGFGLSYTSFQISQPSFKVENGQITATCTLENIGDCAGSEVVQLYVGYNQSQVDRPVKVLRGFEKIALAAGEKQEVVITCPIEKLKWYNPQSKRMELEEMQYEAFIGTSSAEKDLLQGFFTI